MQLRIQRILEGIAKGGRVAGAYLFLGPPGVGKKKVADKFAELLGCKKQDYFAIAPATSSIKIEQVRELQSWVRYGPSVSRYLLVVVEKADALTAEAAAAFLKTLEEPPPGVVFVLLVEREDRLSATILSRCQRIVFSEGEFVWQPDPELEPFYEELKRAKKKNALELLRLSARLEKEREKIEELLYQLAHYAWYGLLNTAYTRVILDALRYIKRRANLKLALDIMCLKLGEDNV